MDAINQDRIDQVRLAFPSYRVFIYGLEVTEDVVAVSVSGHDASSPNSCQISLLNEFDRYIFTPGDIVEINDIDLRSKATLNSVTGGEGLVDGRVKLKLKWGSVPEYNNAIPVEMDRVKREVVLRKSKVAPFTVPMSDRIDPFNNPVSWNNLASKYFTKEITAYPFTDGSPIFHAMDPVRVFERDPYNPSNWYHMFSGFVSDMTETTDTNNVKMFSLTAEDPTKLFRYTRIAMNPGVVDAPKVVQKEDMTIVSFWTNFMVDFSLPEVFYSVLFGPGAIKTNDPKEEKAAYKHKKNSMRGIGQFSKAGSTICTFGPYATDQGVASENKKDVTDTKNSLGKEVLHLTSLANWQSLLDHKVTLFDMYSMARDSDKLNEAGQFNAAVMQARLKVLGPTGNNDDIDIEKVISYIGTRPDEYPVDGGRLMMLLPCSLGPSNTNVLSKGIIQSYGLKTDFTNVGQVLFDTVSRIEFSMYCSPRGDIVVEPPLCDFDPSDFNTSLNTYSSSMGGGVNSGDNGISASGIAATVASEAARVFYSSTLNTQDKFGDNYVVRRLDCVSVESTTTDEKVYTIASTQRALFQGWDGMPYSDIVGDITVVRREALIPIYGVRAAPITNRGYVSTEAAARLYAEITLNRLNADAHIYRVTAMPSIKLWVNRPIYIETRNVLATVRNINHSITWGKNGDMSTTVDLNYARTWNGSIDSDGNMVFTTIGGYAGRPFNYAILFNTAPKPTDIDKQSASLRDVGTQGRVSPTR